jgi:hypothetical protein
MANKSKMHPTVKGSTITGVLGVVGALGAALLSFLLLRSCGKNATPPTSGGSNQEERPPAAAKGSTPPNAPVEKSTLKPERPASLGDARADIRDLYDRKEKWIKSYGTTYARAQSGEATNEEMDEAAKMVEHIGQIAHRLGEKTIEAWADKEFKAINEQRNLVIGAKRK